MSSISYKILSYHSIAYQIISYDKWYWHHNDIKWCYIISNHCLSLYNTTVSNMILNYVDRACTKWTYDLTGTSMDRALLLKGGCPMLWSPRVPSVSRTFPKNPTNPSCRCSLGTPFLQKTYKLYHLESRWRNSQKVASCKGPWQTNTWSCAIYFHYGVIWKISLHFFSFQWDMTWKYCAYRETIAHGGGRHLKFSGPPPENRNNPESHVKYFIFIGKHPPQQNISKKTNWWMVVSGSHNRWDRWTIIPPIGSFPATYITLIVLPNWVGCMLPIPIPPGLM